MRIVVTNGTLRSLDGLRTDVAGAALHSAVLPTDVHELLAPNITCGAWRPWDITR